MQFETFHITHCLGAIGLSKHVHYLCSRFPNFHRNLQAGTLFLLMGKNIAERSVCSITNTQISQFTWQTQLRQSDSRDQCYPLLH